MGHLLGYARVSTSDQQPQLQVDALTAAGCYRVFTETASGARADRPTLEQVLDQLRPGDTLIVWKLDRLGRSLRHLVDTITGLAERGIGFRSLQEAIDTTTPGGKLVFHVFAALAEFERDLIRERTAAGLAAARARGRHGGRPLVLTAQKLKVAQEMYRSGEYTVAAIATTLGSVEPRSTATSSPLANLEGTCVRESIDGRPMLLLRVHQRALQQRGGAVHGTGVRQLPGRTRVWQWPLSGHDPRRGARRLGPALELGPGAEAGCQPPRH